MGEDLAVVAAVIIIGVVAFAFYLILIA